MIFPFSATPAERRLLTEGRLSGPMPWVIAIMMFLTVLAAASGLALANAARNVTGGIANRITVQIVEANPDLREEQTRAAMAALAAMDGVSHVARVPDEEIDRLIEPFLGTAAEEEGIPVPTMIDADLSEALHAQLGEVEADIAAVAPAARVDDHAQFLAPLAGLIRSLSWLALGLVLLIGSALAASVILAARAALNTHRSTIEVLHLMGATDIQIARLFQRRIALDALFGGAVGFLSAVIVLLLLGQRIGAVGSELLGSASLPWTAWLVLFVLPLAGAVLATLVARFTVIGVLRKML
ncbi:cell division protein FtsX [Parasphingopyxis marina]|uniref:Cell division protein n=1 Tax=Parasphingopyxis marina TaxID=2761622 RepID=A0A842HUQ2_9SPHN|nr:cell division protein [Parasphingopyxis marina]MBC2776253.1 cell division protein [Parasphingopyxis marina]